ncbi:TPA: hypothetical protein N0F65_011576 [Lagenidium giganteum]|uniref:Glycosyltransferase family 32 protein n=1 Tax=Lagenidium giganteum TaxID=4803 RepID=A0AAV2YIF2_9STRA|nr:TPA: hypothetical protein N0F65_011576 [Lagenidium giganteum]
MSRRAHRHDFIEQQLQALRNELARARAGAPLDGVDNLAYNNTIPRILHQSWKTADKIPARFESWMRTWRTHNPNWTYVFWDDADNLAIFERIFPQYADVARGVNKIALSDMARYALLYEFGGLYADADFECTKPFAALAKTNELFLSSEPLAHTVLLENSTSLALCNALMASRPRHPFWLRVLDSIAAKFRDPETNLNDPVALTGPRIVKQTYFAEFENDTTVRVYAQEYFYPEIARWNIGNMRKHCDNPTDAATRNACEWLDKYPEGEFTNNTHAVHRWQCTWCNGDRSDEYVTLDDIFPSDRVYRPRFNSTGQMVLQQAMSKPTQHASIPHILHQSWKTVDKIPARFESWMRTWRQHNPDWTYVFWDDDDNLAIFERLFPQFADVAREVNKIALADMARYALLYELGGLYADADFECTKPFDTLAQTNELFLSSEPLAHTVLLEHSSSLALCNALMASRPRHPFWLRLLENIATNFRLPETNRLDPVALTGPRIVKQTYFAEFQNDPTVHVYAQEYFYPEIARWNIGNMRKGCDNPTDAATRAACEWLDKYPEGEFTNNTHAVHRWQCTWCNGDRSDEYVTLDTIFPRDPVFRPRFNATGHLVLESTSTPNLFELCQQIHHQSSTMDNFLHLVPMENDGDSDPGLVYGSDELVHRLDSMKRILELRDPSEQLAEYVALVMEERQDEPLDIVPELLQCAKRLRSPEDVDVALLGAFMFLCETPRRRDRGLAALLPVVAAMLEATNSNSSLSLDLFK